MVEENNRKTWSVSNLSQTVNTTSTDSASRRAREARASRGRHPRPLLHATRPGLLRRGHGVGWGSCLTYLHPHTGQRGKGEGLREECSSSHRPPPLSLAFITEKVTYLSLSPVPPVLHFTPRGGAGRGGAGYGKQMLKSSPHLCCCVLAGRRARARRGAVLQAAAPRGRRGSGGVLFLNLRGEP